MAMGVFSPRTLVYMIARSLRKCNPSSPICGKAFASVNREGMVRLNLFHIAVLLNNRPALVKNQSHVLFHNAIFLHFFGVVTQILNNWLVRDIHISP